MQFNHIFYRTFTLYSIYGIFISSILSILLLRNTKIYINANIKFAMKNWTTFVNILGQLLESFNIY